MIVAVVLLVLAAVGALFALSTWLDVFSSYALFLAAVAWQLGGFILYYALAAALFIALRLIGESNRLVSLLLLTGVAVASGWHCWHLGIASVAWLNAATVFVLAILLARNLRLQFHWLFVLWLFCWAFAYVPDFL